MLMVNHFLRTVSVIAVCCSFISVAGAESVYSQLPTPAWGGVQSSAEPYSLSGGWTMIYKSADDFILDSDASIAQVNWWGHSADGFNHTTESDINQISGFLVEFFEAAPVSNGVGSSVYSEEVPTASTNPTMTSHSAFDGSPVFLHSANLSSAVLLPANTTYWLSISAYLENEPMWVWFASNSGNGIWDRDEDVDGTWDGPFTGIDGSFELIIPEPAGLLLLCLSSFVLLRRR